MTQADELRPEYHRDDFGPMARGKHAKQFEEWLRELHARHPFAKMSVEEILEALHKTHEDVWDERNLGRRNSR